MVFTRTLTKQGTIGDISYKVYTYVLTDATTGGAITVPKGTIFASWTPYTKRASSTITWTTTLGTLTLASLSTSDTGSIVVYHTGGS